jgi:hypothetical protein
MADPQFERDNQRMPRRIIGLFTILLCATVAQGQITQTDIKGHHIGETLRDFILVVNGFDSNGCGGKHLSKEQKEFCKEYGKALKQPSYSFNLPPYQFLFDGGILSLIEISNPQMSFAEALQDATAKYGKPTKQDTLTTRNAFGVKVDTGHARWDMPDGVVLTIDEVIVEGDRSTQIFFRSAAKQKQFENGSAQNPF